MTSKLKQLKSLAFGLLALLFSAGMVLSSCGQTGNSDGADTEAVDEAAGEEHPTDEATEEHPSDDASEEHPSDTTAAEGEHPTDGDE